MKRLLIIITGLFLLVNINTYSQDNQDWIVPCFHCDPIPIYSNDWGMIVQGTLMKKFNSYFKGELNLQSRIIPQGNPLNAYMIEPGIKFKLNKFFALKSAFRFSIVKTKSLWGTYFNKNYRIHIAGYYVWNKEGIPFRIQYRNRIEKEIYFFWRNRIKVAYNFRQLLKPYSSFEIFDQSSNKGIIDLYRYEAGVKWEIHKSFNITFLYRHESNYKYITTNKIQYIGLMVNYSI